MTPQVERRYRRGLRAQLSWHPEKGGKRVWVCFDDRIVEDLGEDPGGSRFRAIAERLLSGQYYPPDAIEFFGEYAEREGRLRVGDRILQRATLTPFWPALAVWSMVEIWVADCDDDHCHIGYVTTAQHHGRGVWQAELTREDGRLKLRVESTACPNSWLFWLGLPLARGLQLRARRRAIEELRKL